MSLQSTYLPRLNPPALFLWEQPGNLTPGRTSPLTYGRGELALLPQATRDQLKLTVQQLELPGSGVTSLTGFLLPMPDGIAGLIAREEWHAGPVPLHPSLSFQVWSLASRFLLELLARQRIVPTVGEDGVSRWRVILTAPEDRKRAEMLARALPPVAYVGSGLGTAAIALNTFLDLTADGLARLPRQPTLPPLRLKASWEEPLMKALVGPFPRVRLQPFALSNLARVMSTWAQPVLGRAGEESWVVCLKLAPPANETLPWRLEYLLQAVDDNKVTVPLGDVWANKAQNGDRRLPSRDAILTRLGEVSGLVPPVAASLAEPNPEGAELTDAEAWKFLTETAEVLAGSAVAVMVPRELVRAGRQRLRARLVVGGKPGGPAPAGTGAFRLDELVEFSYQVALGDEVLSAEQFREVVNMKRPLVRWRDQWIALDPKDQEALETLFNKRQTGTVTGIEALRLALAGRSGRGHHAVEVVAAGELERFLDRLRSTEVDRDPPAPASFRGVLRPYQARGMAWMGLLTDLGLGALLADDMGLGKTIELIAWLLARAERLNGPVLLVCPTSVLGNWEREVQRFAPSLKVVRHHGPQRARGEDAFKGLKTGNVLLTTYALVRRDIEMLRGIPFAAMVLDEAHALKNPRSQQALAVQKIHASHRIALTGTPIENRLTDLWSIMEVLNPGLLGTFASFQHDLALPVERYSDEEAAAELKRLTAPFVLRRVKSDPAVLSDLPEKNEMRVHCALSSEQASLYQAVLDEHLTDIAGATGIARRGRVLALITKLKQVLNHPAHFLRQTGPLPGRSGKLERLEEMLQEVVAADDRALVFTQYREMGDLLQSRISEIIGEPVPFLHGGVPAAERDKMVQRFQEDKEGPHVFVLSLRAGGTGLNLMRANHVFHFDRWWNPAVEDQATDRAFRIGQKRSVQVHKMVTLGTLEEKIDTLLEAKRRLASNIVGTGETWITELDDDELSKLLALSDTVVEEAPDQRDDFDELEDA